MGEVHNMRTPRYILSMMLYDGMFELGANLHFTLDTPLIEAIKKFLKHYRGYDDGRWYAKRDRSKLTITLVDCEIRDMRLFLPSD